MNHKGQVTIAFILLLPFLLVLMIYIVDVGQMYVQMRHIENNTKEAIRYGLKQDPLDESVETKLDTLLHANIDHIRKLDVMVTNNMIYVHIEVQKEAIFGTILKQRNYTIEKTYKGYLDKGKIKIMKE